ncbi:MAG: RNA pseudouridine synthase [Oligoflexia bacterium]|nr:RNA pseudouridine synthase [Oligoflexia bacterium]
MPKIIKQTSNIIAVNKPEGWLTIQGRDPESKKPVLHKWLQDKLNQKVFIVHRLDEGTSGIVVFALNAQTHRQLSMVFENKEVKKTYLAIIQGEIKNQIIDEPIFKLPSKKNKSVVSKEKGKPSQTIIKTLKTNNDLSLLKITPLTGRTHQIRVHLSHLGKPILGDKTYGGKLELNGIKFNYPLLHATSLEFFDEHFFCPPDRAEFNLLFSGLGDLTINDLK